MLTDENKAQIAALAAVATRAELAAALDAAITERNALLAAAPNVAPEKQAAIFDRADTLPDDPGYGTHFRAATAARKARDWPVFWRELIELYRSLRRATPHLEDKP